VGSKIKNVNNKTVIIIGAGPAGLTAGYELLEKTDIIPLIFEETDDIGGLSRTINYKGNRIDIGGHRYYSKSEKVMKWWQNIIPFEGSLNGNSPDPEETDLVMLKRKRISRILFKGKYFHYPIKLNIEMLRNLGIFQIVKICFSYLFMKIFPKKDETYLENFFINRFGKELYITFFKEYTEKVWGVHPNQIKAEWGSQRIKGLSIKNMILHFLKNQFSNDGTIYQKEIETSLIEQFLYPKFGSGQLWEEVSKIIEKKSGKVYRGRKVIRLVKVKDKITSVQIKNLKDNSIENYETDYVFSTMPVKDLLTAMSDDVPDDVKHVSKGLKYRSLIIVGLLLKKMVIRNINQSQNFLKDNWIYIQEKNMKIGRLQIINNWSPYMVKDLEKVWMGLEYFCDEGDQFWEMKDTDLINFAIDELCRIKMIDKKDVLDGTLIRESKAYPCYFGTYNKFKIIQQFTDSIENLFLIGRNGMHCYNSSDYAMLTAINAVENLKQGIKTKDNIWQICKE